MPVLRSAALVLLVTFCIAPAGAGPARAPAPSYDLVVYGGTSAGAAAAIQAARMGKSAVLVEPSRHLGGLSSGGLGFTDSGNKAVIGGIARAFYRRLKSHYDQPSAWKHGAPGDLPRYRPEEDAMWVFEPGVAEETFRRMLAEAGVEVVLEERLDRAPGKGVEKAGDRIVSMTAESGRRFSGRMFIDATYEGDLMAAAGVSYTIGREANRAYGESLNGVEKAKNTHNHRFVVAVDPYVEPGNPRSGLLHGIDPGPYPEDGEGDHRVQAYCFRMCMSDVPENRVPFPKPADYDEAKYELLLRNFEAGDLRLPLKIDRMPNGKTDTNNNCAVSTDCIGQNYRYPEASYEERERIFAAHASYQQGLMWTLANHPRVPESIRRTMGRWGLAKDEFIDNGNWPHQIYVREARRMVSDYVMTELDLRGERDTPASAGMGSYNMDSHNCMRYVTPEGTVQNEGDIQVSPGGPYEISYGSIVPRREECANLLVPVCVSASHIAYGSIRMEPVFMVLGQSAATAAALAIDAETSVQEVDYAKLRERLLADGQVLEHERSGAARRGVDPRSLPGLVVDDRDARRRGEWVESASVAGYVGRGYVHDGDREKGRSSVRFEASIRATAEYEVRFAYTTHANRASRVPVVVLHAGGQERLRVDQTKAPPIDGRWISLGTFRFETSAAVEVGNAGTEGYVVADAVQFLPVGRPARD